MCSAVLQLKLEFSVQFRPHLKGGYRILYTLRAVSRNFPFINAGERAFVYVYLVFYIFVLVFPLTRLNLWLRRNEIATIFPIKCFCFSIY